MSNPEIEKRLKLQERRAQLLYFLSQCDVHEYAKRVELETIDKNRQAYLGELAKVEDTLELSKEVSPHGPREA